ncbi:hypothetical protein GCM10027088_32990 [Nocardia goodfellowii]
MKSVNPARCNVIAIQIPDMPAPMTAIRGKREWPGERDEVMVAEAKGPGTRRQRIPLQRLVIAE